MKSVRVTGLPESAQCRRVAVAICHTSAVEADGTFSTSGIYASLEEAVRIMAALPTAIIEALPDAATRQLVRDTIAGCLAALDGPDPKAGGHA